MIMLWHLERGMGCKPIGWPTKSARNLKIMVIVEDKHIRIIRARLLPQPGIRLLIIQLLTLMKLCRRLRDQGQVPSERKQMSAEL